MWPLKLGNELSIKTKKSSYDVILVLKYNTQEQLLTGKIFPNYKTTQYNMQITLIYNTKEPLIPLETIALL